jgi:hypothetical protein
MQIKRKTKMRLINARIDWFLFCRRERNSAANVAG